MPSSDAYVGLIDTVVAMERPRLPESARLNQAHRRLLSMCASPVAVVDLASDVNLPIGVVRVLLSDLASWGAVRVVQAPRGPVTDLQLLRDVLDGLQAL
jgi:hypothetical protein